MTQDSWKRKFILFLSTQTISLFGTSLVQYAIMWHITLVTKSGIMMTIYIICGFLPTFFLSPFAGVWADRFHRKKIIILSDSFIAIVTLILALLYLSGIDAIWILFVVVVMRAIGTGIQTPAVSAVLPQIVPEEHLTKANGANTSIQSLVMLISPMVSAALLTLSTIEIIFFIDVFTAAIAVLTLLFFLRIPVHAKALEQRTVGYFSDLKQGFSYIRTHAYLKNFFLFMALFVFMSAPVAFLTPLQVTRSFGDDVWRLTAIEIVFSVGMMAGGGLIAAWGGFKNRIHTMTFACIGMGIGTLLLGVVPLFWIYLAFMGFIGIMMPVFNTPATVLLQEKVEPDFLGRVFGVMGMIMSSTMPLGMLVFGPIADVVEIEWLLLITGLFIILLSFLLAGNRTLAAAGAPKASDNEATQN